MTTALLYDAVKRFEYHEDTVPSLMLQRQSWITWQYEGTRKIPHDGTRRVNAHDESTHLTFYDAVYRYETNEAIDGIGFVLGNGIIGIDLDDVIGDDGRITNHELRGILDNARTYIEYSPSRTGLHVLMQYDDARTLKGAIDDTSTAEIYADKRYFTYTGDVYSGGELEYDEDTLNNVIQLIPAANGSHYDTTRRVNDAQTYRLKRRTIKEIKADLARIPATGNYDDWQTVGFAVHDETNGSHDGLTVFDEWCAAGPNYDKQENRRFWRNAGSKTTRITYGTLVRRYNLQAGRAYPDDAARSSFTLPKPVTGYETKPKPVVMYDGLFPAGKTSLLSGAGGVGKSSYILTLLAHLCTGAGMTLAKPTRPIKALYVSYDETKQDLQRKLHTLLRLGFNIEGRLHALSMHGMNNAQLHDGDKALAAAGEIERFIKNHDVNVAVIDHVTSAFTGDQNDRLHVGSFLDDVSARADDTGAAFILLGHLDKAASRTNSATAHNYSGSQVWNSGPRSRVAVMKTGKDTMLQHEKCNVTREQSDQRLYYHDGLAATYDLRILELFPANVRGGGDTLKSKAEAAGIENYLEITNQLISLGLVEVNRGKYQIVKH